MSFPFTHKNGRICCSSPQAMCPTCAAKVAASRLAGEAVPPAILKAAKEAMKAHLNSGHATEADVLALEAEIRAASNNREDTMTNDYAPPDPYARDIARLRAAAATPASTFEDTYKADRLRELDAEYARLATFRAAQKQPRLTAAELAKYAPPSPYDAGIKALQEGR